ncbi:uncharacterized protein RJT21DRAFT_87365 [Scheffersomyces amazonensis]|uniref:uncharacterized protein n=1 Tax=Scheffersomyces amazonensis TaxID=1078765 RepID=UPI00315DC898
MDIVAGACSVDKVSGMIHIREDLTPSMLEWKAIDQDKVLAFPLNTISNLQATKEDSPKMILKLFYKVEGVEEPKTVKLTFTNRPTMNNIKDSLQTVVARQRTIIKDQGGNNNNMSPAYDNDSKTPMTATPTPGPSSDRSGKNNNFTASSGFSEISLSDSALLKNLQLQQKLLFEDKQLRDIFTQSVIEFKLSPTTFWSTRINQLRTYALTISQHKGPYNVLSTIKVVATSDNQVNVNVTRNVINEIFQTYPVIKKAFSDLVPAKFDEGEFWSRFFNSKLFRRLRGDKINNATGRGDVSLDKYLYIDQKYIDQEAKEVADQSNEATKIPQEEVRVNKFIDLYGNEEDNSQKLGNQPDFTMRFEEDFDNETHKKLLGHQENEMIILMKNMNKLSSKMVNMTNIKESTPMEEEMKAYEEELNLHDLEDAEDLKYITIHIDTNKDMKEQALHDDHHKESQLSQQELIDYLRSNEIKPQIDGGIDLTDVYKTKDEEITKSLAEINTIVRQNFRTFKVISREVQNSENNSLTNLVSNEIYQDIIKYNITIVEFLSHFWKLYLSKSSKPKELRNLFNSLRNCEDKLKTFKNSVIEQVDHMESVKANPKLRDKIIQDFQNSIDPMEISLKHACAEYINSVRAAQQEGTPSTEAVINGNGKRLLEP